MNEDEISRPVAVALAVVSVLILTALITSAIAWVRLWRAGRSPLGQRPIIAAVPRTRPDWNPAWAAALLILVGLIAGVLQNASRTYLTGMTAPDDSAAGPSVTLILISSIATAGACLLVMIGTVGSIPAAVRYFAMVPNGSLVRLGLSGALLLLPPTMLMMGAVSMLQAYSHPVLEAAADVGPGAGWRFAALFVTTALVTPVVEEFWFRGLLQGGLQGMADRRLLANAVEVPGDGTNTTNATDGTVGDGTWRDSYAPPSQPSRLTDRSSNYPIAVWPIFVASAIFAAMHLGQGLAPIPLFFLSLGLGYLYRQTGSLVPSIVVHLVLNGFTMLVTGLQLLG